MSRDRDRILEQALMHELKGVGTPPTAPALRSFSEGGCLDAETLGAWQDGGLDPAAMAACEAHVANCARCQVLVGTLARSLSVSTESTLGTPGTLSLWKWWLAPIAAGVTGVTLWMVVPEQQSVADAPAMATVARDQQTFAAPADAEVKAKAPAALPGAPEQNVARERLETRDKLAAAAPADRVQLSDAAAPKAEEAKRMAENVAGQRRDAAAPPPPAAPSPARAPAAAALEAPVAGLQKSVRAEVAAIEIATLDPSVGWRVVGDRILRSDNGGATWVVVRQDAGDRIVAGSAPSTSVCWFIGAAGRVLLTVNSGATFVDVSLAEPLDLASVAATDARNAMIFSVVGRRFRTDDGGRTWRPY
jgi:hypothetical protein